MTVGSDSAAVHRSGLRLSTVLKPDGGPRRARWINKSEILEVVRYECGHFNEFVVVSGGIVLQLTDGQLLRLLLARRNRNKCDNKSQHCECESTLSHRSHSHLSKVHSKRPRS